VTANPIPKTSRVGIENFTFVKYSTLSSLTVACVSGCTTDASYPLYIDKINGILYVNNLFMTTAVSIGGTVVFTISGFTNPNDNNKHYFNMYTLDS
jgi:hypothetical protein